MDAETRTCRKMVGHLRINPNLVRKVGLPKIPSKSTIRRAYGMIPEAYLREVHTRIIGDVMRHDPQLRIGPSMPIILQMCAPKACNFRMIIPKIVL